MEQVSMRCVGFIVSILLQGKSGKPDFCQVQPMQVHRLPNPNPAPTFICKQARAFRADSVKRFVWIEDRMGGHGISTYCMLVWVCMRLYTEETYQIIMVEAYHLSIIWHKFWICLDFLASQFPCLCIFLAAWGSDFNPWFLKTLVTLFV